MPEFEEAKQSAKLETLLKREKESLAQNLAEKYSLPYINLTLSPVSPSALRVMSEKEAREAQMVVFSKVGKHLKIAILDPQNPKVVELIKGLKASGLTTSLYLASEESLSKMWNRYKDLSITKVSQEGSFDIAAENIDNFIKKSNSLEAIRDLIGSDKSGEATSLLEITLGGALALKASDIHIEPEKEKVKVRYRLDGLLTDLSEISLKNYQRLVSRIKILSGLKLNVVKDAQDGRFSIHVGEKDIEIRTSVIPGGYGESVVMRVLDPTAISVGLDNLGISPKLLEIFKREIKKPNGMILNTGPTGSGKTTTLYAFLKAIYSPDIKIITIEDPIEYHLEGVVQTQVEKDTNYTFLSGLRATLRQDPDVIMVGEIRDAETAAIATNAALTGHLVFSTLHTNNAAGTFPRLIDLKVNPKVIGPALSLSIAQRLVRRLCPKCKSRVKLEGERKEIIDDVLSGINDPSLLEGIQREHVYEAEGCESCTSGYKGRTGIYEAILMDEEVEKVVRSNPGEKDIIEAASNQNIPNMAQDGVIKILNGVTSFEELQRVTGI